MFNILRAIVKLYLILSQKVSASDAPFSLSLRHAPCIYHPRAGYIPPHNEFFYFTTISSMLCKDAHYDRLHWCRPGLHIYLRVYLGTACQSIDSLHVRFIYKGFFKNLVNMFYKDDFEFL